MIQASLFSWNFTSLWLCSIWHCLNWTPRNVDYNFRSSFRIDVGSFALKMVLKGKPP
ncbi:hypothetical protein AMTRI_Chr11g95520 [Amborella trichopoda]